MFQGQSFKKVPVPGANPPCSDEMEMSRSQKQKQDEEMAVRYRKKINMEGDFSQIMLCNTKREKLASLQWKTSTESNA